MLKNTPSLRKVAIGPLALTLCVAAATIGYALHSGGIWPEATGINVSTKSDLTIDYSNTDDGYVMARGASTRNRLKLRVSKGKAQLTYDINSDGEYESFPLQMGNGNYQFDMFSNVSGNKYAQAGSMSITAQMEDENVAFLSPNQYVEYTEESQAVLLSHEMLDELEDDQAKIDAVVAYIRENFEYDFDKARKITSGTMPDIDYVFENGMGICQDLSALMACMLRVQGIPTQFVIGYVGKNYYHAWNNVLIDGEYKLYDMTAEVGALPNENMGYTVERYY